MLAPVRLFSLNRPVSDRLNELQRQRSLLLEHLAWLDREIAAVNGPAAPARPVVPSPVRPLVPATAAPADEPALDALMAQYQDEGDNLQSSVKRGCFLYFALTFVVIGLGLLGLYFYTTRK
jgi:hypothetical protein